MSTKLTQLIAESATLSPQERLELAAYLKSLQNSPDRWDLSAAAIARQNAEMRKLLAEWREMGDEVEQSETIEHQSIAAKYAGSLEFSDDEFAAMLKELEEDK
jgi:hypothetical protein